MIIIKNVLRVLITLMICISTLYSQKLIRVDSIPYNHLKKLFSYTFRDSQTNNYYKIFHVQQDSTIDNNKFRYFFEGISVEDTVKVIEDLLMLKGDSRLCAIPIIAYSINASHSYAATYDTIRFCSIEIEALFIINQLMSYKPIRYQSYPLLKTINREEKLEPNEIVKRAYLAYEKWFKKVKKRGLYWTKKRGLYPLKGSGLKWYE